MVLRTSTASPVASAACQHDQSARSRQSYKSTLLTRNSAPLGPYSRTKHRALWWPLGGWLFLMSEVPLYTLTRIRKTDPALLL